MKLKQCFFAWMEAASKKGISRGLFPLVIGIFIIAVPVMAQCNLLHEFTGSVSDGSTPQYSKMVSSGTTLFGMTLNGGSNGYGVIYSIQADGNGFMVLHSFAGGSDDGAYPYGGLTLSGTSLFGMTSGGGSSDKGTIFKIDTNGANFALLHHFTGSTSDGANPRASLVISDSVLYGMTWKGGLNNLGTIFKMNSDGNGFSLLYSFVGGANDGKYPQNSLCLSGSTLYGMTLEGGDALGGTLFKIDTDGSDYAVLREFVGGENDGAFPWGDLIAFDSYLYGMTWGGGNWPGVIFKVRNDGSDFSILHKFTASADDGGYPKGSLLLSNSFLYGMTTQGGDDNLGTIFKIKIDGSEFDLLHEFAGGGADGATPMGDLLLSGSRLFAATSAGGDSNIGVIFSYSFPVFALTAPNGWERWNLGESREITWTPGEYTGTVRLVLFKGGTRFGNIATGVDAAAGSYNWTVGLTYDNGMAPAGSDFRMYLRSTDNTLVDPSDYRFALITPAAQLELTSPNGGEIWSLGSTQNITWNANGYSGTVRLILFNKAAKIGQIVANIPASQGSYAWTVGQHQAGTAPAGSLYSIRLLAGDGSQEDYSDAPFTISEE